MDFEAFCILFKHPLFERKTLKLMARPGEWPTNIELIIGLRMKNLDRPARAQTDQLQIKNPLSKIGLAGLIFLAAINCLLVGDL